MLESTRNPVLRRRMERLARQSQDWDFEGAFSDLDLEIRVSTHQEVRDHYLDVVDILKRYGRWDSSKIANFMGVTRQTSYQYGFRPTARGTRLVPADKLDRLREAAMAAMDADIKRGFAPGVTPESRTWQVFVGMNLRLETYSQLYGESLAARLVGVCVPHNRHKNPNAELSAEDQLCVDWLTWRHAGLVTKADAIRVAGVDEYLEGRVGCEAYPWRIAPTVAQVAALKAIHEHREKQHA